MSAAEMLPSLGRLGIKLSVKGGELLAVGPRSALTAEVQNLLKAHKAELIALVSDPERLRDQLLLLAKSEELPSGPVLALTRADLTACLGEPEDTLRAYVRALARAERMSKGLCPLHWTQASECGGCGPVWLAEGSPGWVKACPWCFHRVKGVQVPHPPVRCEGCRYFRPDLINPQGGIGECAVRGKPCEHPVAPHVCGDFRSSPPRGE